MKKINRKTKQLRDSGITLVALIITIIILIILAAVTIKTLTHDGLLDMAIKGAEDYKTAEGKELEEMNKLSNSLNSIISGTGSEDEGEKDPVIIEGVITFSGLTWSNQKASVTVHKTTTDNLQIEYQVLDRNNQAIRPYATITNGGTVDNLNLGDLVIARLTDGSNHGNTASIEVTDGKAPTAPTFGTPSGTVGNNSWYKSDVTVGITPGTDNESGVLKTTYSITGAGEKGETEGTSVTISSEGTSVITAYTYDKAGHKTASTALTIKIDKTAPSAVNLSFNTKTDRTVTVNVSGGGTDTTSGIAKYIFEYKKSTETNWKTEIEQTSLPSSYEYTGLTPETGYNFRVKTVDNAGNEGTGTSISQTTEAERVVITEADIGKTVDYKPTGGTYSTTQNGTEYSGASKQDFKTADLTGGWKIWSIDDTHIYLVSENSTASTSKKLTLASHRGYNNGVTLLDNICNACWGNTSYRDIEARSMKLSDILKVTTVTNYDADKYGTTPYSYSFKYPYIWNQYEKTAGTDITKREETYDLTTSDALTSNLSYKPTYTVWYNQNMNTSSAYKSPYGAQYQAMVTKPASSTYYWLSSRFVYPSDSSSCYFGLQGVDSRGVSYYYLYCRNSNGSPGSGSDSFAVRPLVQIPLASCYLTEGGENGENYHISPR